jgi:dynein cytoplasmic 2 heavy chain
LSTAALSHNPWRAPQAVAFEGLIKASGSAMVTWEQSRQVEGYIAKLQAAVGTLSAENRKLRRWHDDMTARVVRLMNTDLLRDESKFRDLLAESKSIISHADAAGYENTSLWKLHWDRQLYKAFEAQWQLGLESLNEHLPDIKVELVRGISESRRLCARIRCYSVTAGFR